MRNAFETNSINLYTGINTTSVLDCLTVYSLENNLTDTYLHLGNKHSYFALLSHYHP